MSDWHGSDSPSKSWSFRRSNSPAHVLCGDQDSESALDMFMDAGYANVNGDDWVYQVRTPPFFSTSPPAFPSYAEDSFAELPVCTCITETDPAPFSQESAMIGCFAEIQLSAGAFHDKEYLMAPESSAMRSFGGSAHALQPHLEVLGVPAPSDGQGFGTDSISEPTVLDHASASGNRSCSVVLAPSLKEQLFGPIRARVDVHSAQVSGCSRTGALPDVVILRSCGSERGKTMQQRLNPLGRQSDDVETSDPIARSHAVGAIKNANLTLVTRADCTGFSWSVKIRFSTKLHNQKVEFGTQNPKALHQKNFEFWLTAQNMSTGGSEDFKFAGRLMNSNKKKPNPDWLILHFMGIKNDDLPHVNCAARHVRQFVDHAVLKEAQAAHVAAVLPTYQLLFHGSIQYEHAHFQMDDDAAEALKKMCAESAALKKMCEEPAALHHFDFGRSKGRGSCCTLRWFRNEASKDPCFTIEIYPSQFKVTERYEDQDMAGLLCHKHMPVIDTLRSIIDQLCQSKRHASRESSTSGSRSHSAAAATGGGLPLDAESENWELFSDDGFEDDFGPAEWSDGSFVPICCKRFRGS